VLTKCCGQVVLLHVLLNLLKEVVWSKDLLDVWVLVVCFVCGVLVIYLLSSNWSPLFDCNKGILEDFLCVDLDKSPVAIVGDTTTVVTL
jgi:hypothetical protein